MTDRFCASCGATVTAGDAFCRQCGARLEAPVVATQAQRRHLTALFYDLVGSTELSTEVDAEDYQHAMSLYQHRCASVVREYGGTPANTMGDGGLVYFGYPHASEDDPLRAVTAGLALIESLEPLNEQVRREIPGFTHELALRVGIHTGSVILGEVGSDLGAGRLASGDTLNQASRIEGVAPVNGVAISEATARRVRGVVELTPLGLRDLKGFADPIEVFAVDRIRPTQSRISLTPSSLSPIVGRDDEFEVLLDAWRDALSGHSRTVVLRGDAGIGKSRLHRHLRQHLAGARHAWFEIYGSAIMNQSAFHPVTEAIRQLLAPDPDDDPRGPDAFHHLRRLLESVGITDQGTLDILAVFLSLREPLIDEMAPDERRRRTLDAVCDWWLATARTVPTVFVAEDVHWYDPSTLELIQMLVQRSRDEPMLLVATVRPSIDLKWEDKVTVLDLDPLTSEQVAELIGALTEGSNLTEAQRSALAARSDGVPLFVEELTHVAITDHPRAVDAPVPETLVDLLTARLDRLGPERHVVQTASLLGREFSEDLINEVIDPTLKLDVHQLVTRLIEDRFLEQRGLGESSRLTFRHALIQDVAQESMLRRQRQLLHGRIATVLTASFSDSPDGRPEIIGYHLENAGDLAGALEQYVIAARDLWRRVELVESSTYYRRSLDLLATLDPGTARDEREIELQLEFANTLGRTSTFGAPTVIEAYERAAALSTVTAGSQSRLVEAVQGVGRCYLTTSRLVQALESAHELESLAEQSGDRLHELSATISLCQIYYWQGNFAECLTRSNRARELYRPDDPWEARHSLGVNNGVTSLLFRAYSLWAMGFTDQSEVAADEAIAESRDERDIYQLAHALTYMSIHSIMLNDPARTFDLASHGRELAREHRFTSLYGLTTWTEGWARYELGESSGIVLASEGVSLMANAGAALGAPGCLAVMAEMCAKAGALEDAHGYVALGADMAAQSGQNFYLTEIYRSSALAYLGSADDASGANSRQEAMAAASTAAWRAVEVARDQESPSLELRAIQPLATILRREGHEDEAHELLVQVVEKFPAGARGVDLDAARNELLHR